MYVHSLYISLLTASIRDMELDVIGLLETDLHVSANMPPGIHIV